MAPHAGRNVYIAQFAIVQEDSRSPDTPPTDAARMRVGRKASRGLSRPALLMVEVTETCAARSLADAERETTPLFVGAPSGAEIAMPYVDQYLANEEAGGLPHTPANVITGGRAGNLLAFLKFSQGNVCGHIAQATGIKGANSLFTGSEAGYHALRKAWQIIKGGWCDGALVVSGEVLLSEASYYDGQLNAHSYSDSAVALHLVSDPSRVRIGQLAQLEVPTLAEEAIDVSVDASWSGEATTMLMELVRALRGLAPRQAHRIAKKDRWGNSNQLCVQVLEQAP